MKHIFYIHSHLTYIISIGVINELALDKKNVFILSDGYTNNLNYPINMIRGKKYTKNKFRYHIFHFNIPKSIDTFIKKLIKNEEFTLYCPAITHTTSVLLTNENCKQLHFIEEGFTSYLKNLSLERFSYLHSNKNWRYKNSDGLKAFFSDLILLLRGMNMKLNSLPIYYNCYFGFSSMKFFGLSNDAFPIIENSNKHIINIKDISNSIDYKSSFLINDNANVWIGDCSVDTVKYNRQLYLTGIKEGFINYLNKNSITNIYIKFHPNESQYSRNCLLNVLTESNITFSIIPDSTILELELLYIKKISLFGIYSSLLYYNTIMGNNSYSIINYEPEYKSFLEKTDMSFYWNKIQII